jgi:hypothetical protein
MASMPKIAVTVLVATGVALIVACGDSKPDPKTPDTTPSATPVASDTPPATSASAAPLASAAPPDAGAPPVSANGAPTEMKDECTPVGVDFEKRARPKMKECYAEGKKKTGNPNLQGTVKIKLTIDLKGKIKNTKVIEKTLPDSVADCMLKVVKATPFPEVDKCWDSTITIPITFPTPP